MNNQQSLSWEIVTEDGWPEQARFENVKYVDTKTVRSVYSDFDVDSARVTRNKCPDNGLYVDYGGKREFK